jgi:hypothetical protein
VELSYVQAIPVFDESRESLTNFLQIYANYLIHVGYNAYRKEREVTRWWHESLEALFHLIIVLLSMYVSTKIA